MGHRDSPAPLDSQVRLALPGTLALLVSLEDRDFQDRLDRQVPLEELEILDHLAQMEAWARLVAREVKEMQDHLEQLDHRVRLGQKVPLERPDLPARLDK